LNEEEVLVVGRALTRQIGMRFDPVMSRRLHRCLLDGAAGAGLSLADYAQLVDLNAELRQDLLDRVTIPETSFFRDGQQLQALADHVLPGLPDPLLLWSAGCATGQEVYSLAMVLAESGRRDWRVIGTDVSEKALAKARRGLYSHRDLRGLSVPRRERHLVTTEAGHQVGD
jgi:chemotaxis methyl-accepting protein methylase